jgi:hypothetical protein
MRAEVTGLLRTENEQVYLDTLGGEHYRLDLGGDAALLGYLAGDSVALSGPRLGQRIWVRNWNVITGADGSAPFLGRLEWHGANLVLMDRNSGARFVFDEASLKALEPGAGKNILVRGFIVGPHVLHVMNWRILGPEEP